MGRRQRGGEHHPLRQTREQRERAQTDQNKKRANLFPGGLISLKRKKRLDPPTPSTPPTRHNAALPFLLGPFLPFPPKERASETHRQTQEVQTGWQVRRVALARCYYRRDDKNQKPNKTPATKKQHTYCDHHPSLAPLPDSFWTASGLVRSSRGNSPPPPFPPARPHHPRHSLCLPSPYITTLANAAKLHPGTAIKITVLGGRSAVSKIKAPKDLSSLDPFSLP